jgi:hypothetical protein
MLVVATTGVVKHATSMPPTLANPPSGLAAALAETGVDTLVHVPRQAHGLAGFRDWVLGEDFPEKLKATYLGGEVYLDISKEDINAHALVKTELIDARGAELDFQLLVWRKSGYVAAPSRDGWVRSPLFKRSFRMTRRRDRSEAWKYRLETK